MSSGPRNVVVEADGGSRGNPGPAAYGAVLRDGGTGEVIAEDCGTLGVATNNVAEYQGLLAGLRLVAEHAPGAAVEVRMDSQLVVEQMSGRWRIKHPALKPLAVEADRLAPPGTTYTWVPRARNQHADRLANEALDGRHGTATGPLERAEDREDSLVESIESPPVPGDPRPTTLILVRHGVTPHTSQKRFSGGLGGANPGLSEEGRAQVRATAEWLAPAAERVDAVVASPVRRTRESAEILAEVLGRAVEEEPGVAEMEFGHWDGLTFAEVGERHHDELEAWLGSMEYAPPGGESFRDVEKRVLAGRDRLLADHAGRTVVVVSHVTPIKILVADALGAPLDAVFRMELAPASMSVVAYFPGGPDGEERRPSLRLYNASAQDVGAFASPTTW